MTLKQIFYTITLIAKNYMRNKNLNSQTMHDILAIVNNDAHTITGGSILHNSNNGIPEAYGDDTSLNFRSILYCS